MKAIKPQPLITRPRLIAIAVVVVLLGITFVLWQWWKWRVPGVEAITAGKFPEALVYVRSQDDIVNGGAIFTPPKDLAKPIAVIWIHGWGVNFYYPTYVMIGRALAERAYTCITANTRMHDLGNVAGWRGENESAAVVIGGWPVRKYETSRPGSASQRIEDSRRWCWLDTAQAGLQFAGTRLRSTTDVLPGWFWLPGRFEQKLARLIRNSLRKQLA